MADTPIVVRPPFPPHLQVINAKYSKTYWRKVLGQEEVIVSIVSSRGPGADTMDLVACVWGSDLFDARSTAELLRLGYNGLDIMLDLIVSLSDRLDETRDGPAVADAKLVTDARELVAAIRAGIAPGVPEDVVPLEEIPTS